MLVGVGTSGPLRLDLQTDGPHFLVAGTTGSGKSELLRTLAVGLVGHYPPDRVNLLFIDFKGGSGLRPLAGPEPTASGCSRISTSVKWRARSYHCGRKYAAGKSSLTRTGQPTSLPTNRFNPRRRRCPIWCLSSTNSECW